MENKITMQFLSANARKEIPFRIICFIFKNSDEVFSGKPSEQRRVFPQNKPCKKWSEVIPIKNMFFAPQIELFSFYTILRRKYATT